MGRPGALQRVVFPCLPAHSRHTTIVYSCRLVDDNTSVNFMVYYGTYLALYPSTVAGLYGRPQFTNFIGDTSGTKNWHGQTSYAGVGVTAGAIKE